MKYTFIVNPKSSSGHGGMIWDILEPELKKRRIGYEVFFTEYERHATEITRQITEDGEEHTLVVLGGDGTVNEVINGIYDCGKVTLGYIPTGSGNDFTRAVNLPTDPYKALENILKPGRVVPMDVGCIQCDGEVHRFAVSTGIGFDAAVCHQVAVSRLKVMLNKVGLGSLSYLGVALKRLMKDKPVRAVLTLDEGEQRVFEKTYFAAAMNHPYEGGGFFFCPKAKIDDGMLDVIVVSELPKWKILLLLPTAFIGKHVGFRGIDIFRCREMKIETEEKLPVHTDGEPVAVSEQIQARLLSEQIRLIVPQGGRTGKLPDKGTHKKAERIVKVS